jgi:5-formaminoimidazole-4-carboxamide-1-(beta)-D-ribofuranosyl 5'-monophosphate synthetase
MIPLKYISEVLADYNGKDVSIGTLGSHSALDICRGAVEENFRTLVVCQIGREKAYDTYFHSRRIFDHDCGVVNKTLILEKFRDILELKNQKELKQERTIFVPHRSFSVYVPYSGIENDFLVPIFGNRYLLRLEERFVERNQYYLLEKAKIRSPYRFTDYSEIDRLVIVKLGEAKRSYERAFFIASSPNEYEKLSKQLINQGIITEKSLDNSTIEEFILGTHFNFNFFYSPLLNKVELLGTDSRRQTNLDGLLRLPASEQLKISKKTDIRNIEVGHIATTIRESLLEKIFKIGEDFVKVTKKEYPPGIIGPFALQGAIIPGPPSEEIVIFDVSLRVPGSPGTKYTPYSEYLWGFPVSTGRRIAMEIKEAIQENRIEDVVT